MTDIRLSTVLRPQDVVLGFRAEALRDAVDSLLRARLTRALLSEDDASAAIDSIMRREAQGSTATGVIAVPHARIAGITEFVAALGVNPAGVFAEDDAPRLMLSFVSPVDAAAAHLRFLSSVANAFRRESVISDLLQAADGGSVVDILRDNGV
jgi:mannitol/fructose-specific phosphotransferase system IIA component (Ntr-type)